jgi:hypothetical protein
MSPLFFDSDFANFKHLSKSFQVYKPVKLAVPMTFFFCLLPFALLLISLLPAWLLLQECDSKLH